MSNPPKKSWQGSDPPPPFLAMPGFLLLSTLPPLPSPSYFRMYSLVLTEQSLDDPYVDLRFVERDHYTGGVEIAINDQETMVSYPQITQHGTSNPSYTALPRSDGLFDLKLPPLPNRVAVLFYLHKYMHEPNHGRDRVKILGASGSRIQEDRKNEGKRIATYQFGDKDEGGGAKRKK